MNHLENIRNAFDRMEQVFGKRPAAALGSGVMSARLVDGLRCEAREAAWRFTIDMPGDAGGTNAGPPPGVHGRAALASCLAIGYGICLARAGITPQSLEVVVQADFDNRGLVGMEDAYPGYLKVQHTLFLECDAPKDTVQAAIDEAQRCSPYLHIFRDAQPVTGRVVFGPRPQAV